MHLKGPRPLLNPPFSTTNYATIDLIGISIEDTALYIQNRFTQTGASVLYGGYLERRELYSTFNHFEAPDIPVRNIHLGVDFWAAAGTPIYSPLPGRIHSFANRKLPGDYGPVVLLEHLWNGAPLFSLYGHLSTESIALWSLGSTFQAGDVLGYLGNLNENGGYEPHLHFQLIRDIGNWKGDYPGVAAEGDLQFYRENCPNPLVFLGFDEMD